MLVRMVRNLPAACDLAAKVADRSDVRRSTANEFGFLRHAIAKKRKATPRASQPQLGQSRIVVGPAARRPPEQPLGLGDPRVVDTSMVLSHVAIGVEQPQLVAVTAPLHLNAIGAS